MKKQLAVLLAAAMVLGFSTGKATAAPANFQLTLTTDSGATLNLDILSGAITAAVPFVFTGTIDASIDDAIQADLINDSTGFALTGADIAIGDVLIDLNAGIFGGIQAEMVGAGINVLNTNGYIPTTTTNPTNPWEYTFDPGGGTPTELSIDEGLFTYLGTGGLSALLGSGTLDFADDPVEAELGPVGQIGMITQNAVVSDGYVYVTVSAPITFADQLITDPVQVDADLSGALVATGMYQLVPEPSTVVLLGIAIVGLIPVLRRRRK